MVALPQTVLALPQSKFRELEKIQDSRQGWTFAIITLTATPPSSYEMCFLASSMLYNKIAKSLKELNDHEERFTLQTKIIEIILKQPVGAITVSSSSISCFCISFMQSKLCQAIAALLVQLENWQVEFKNLQNRLPQDMFLQVLGCVPDETEAPGGVKCSSRQKKEVREELRKESLEILKMLQEVKSTQIVFNCLANWLRANMINPLELVQNPLIFTVIENFDSEHSRLASVSHLI